MIEKIKNIFNKIIRMFNDMKRDRKKVLLIVGGMMFLVIVLIIGNINSFNGLNDAKKIVSEYNKLNNKVNSDGKKYPEVNIDKDNNFEYVKVKDVLNIFEENDDAVVFLGYASCVYCRSAIQVLYDTAKETKLDKIYYLDIEKKNGKYKELRKVLGNEFLDEDGEIYSPLVLFIADGKIVSYNAGTLFSQTDPFDELDPSQRKGLSEIYRYGIKDVLNGMN